MGFRNMARFDYLKLLPCRIYLQLRRNYYVNTKLLEITRKSVGPPYKVLLQNGNLRSLYWEQMGTNKKNSWFSKYIFSKNCDKNFTYAAQEISVLLDLRLFQFLKSGENNSKISSLY
jgi:hypothetical protein